MKHQKKIFTLLLAAIMLLSAGCAAKEAPEQTTAPATETTAVTETTAAAETTAATETTAGTKAQVASASDMAGVADVAQEGLTPISGDAIKDGVYEIAVDCSSSMFKIVKCELTVKDGQMTACLYMGGTGYLKVFMGTGEEAAAASEESFIPFVQTGEGIHTYTVPVEALNQVVNCAAYSKNKEMWYDRSLLFRADSLPLDAFGEGAFATVESLGLEDGNYTVEAKLEGGSGRASVQSPAALRVENGVAYATVVMSSANYDYMKVDGQQYLPVNTEGNAAFEIPVAAFDWKIPILADTTAMSTPHEIEYTLCFDSASLKSAQ